MTDVDYPTVGEGAVRTTGSLKTFKSAFAHFASKYGKETSDQRMHDHVDKLWEKYDRDESGYLEEAEAQLFFKSVWNWLDSEGVELVPGASYEKWWNEFDRNKDGKLSKDEFKAVIRKALAMSAE
eukprot:TRINITY_DN5099_c0_g1_i2.p1 TRINITY_DN5099_c0_g1~~TRINITY_DN5099_c0_g1_i2.p1  ORF type:complete len:125 (+),score=22.74 TRINITY_DN5099_c0_g1_i2:6-380(+)